LLVPASLAPYAPPGAGHGQGQGHRATTFAARPVRGEINSIREDDPRAELPAMSHQRRI
jgi:hypothetical protein